MKARKKRPQQRNRQLSRKLLNREFDELVKRLSQEVEAIEHIAQHATPVGTDLVGAVPKLTVLSDALNVHCGNLRQFCLGYAQILADRANGRPA